jgi:site-specific DNA recombinase
VSRKLVPNPQEVKIVQEIFRRFSLVPSMATLVHDLRARGVTSKSWVTIKGIQRTGKLVDKGFLYKILNNPVYVGIASYKGKHYTGEQPAIIDQPVWEKVQANLAKGRANRPLHAGRADRTSQAPCLLKGLLYSNEGRCFTPGYTRKKDKFYRYYINTDAIKIGPKSCEIQRLPAGDIESVITAKVKEILQTPEVTAAAVREVCRLRPDIEEYEAINALRSIDEIWNELFPAERSHIVRSLINRITVRTTGLTIDWASDGMAALITQTVRPKDDLQEAA